MMQFTDNKGNKVDLELQGEVKETEHVLMIPYYEGNIVLTHHKERGIEFPGGKKEQGEDNEMAVTRELMEETGARISSMRYIGQYTVHTEQPFSKAVYYVTVSDIEFKDERAMETYGPLIVSKLEDIPEEDKSELLKDDCILYIHHYIKERVISCS